MLEWAIQRHHERMVSVITAWGVRWTGLPHRDWWRSSNWRQSRPLLSKDLWNSKGKERKVVPPGIKPIASGFICQCSTTEPAHPPTTTPPPFPFITLLLSDYWWTCVWLLCAIVDHERMVSIFTAWGVQWSGLPHSSKTNGDFLIEYNLQSRLSSIWRTSLQRQVVPSMIIILSKF